MLLSHCSHHTTSGGVGELPTPSGLLAQLQSLCQRVSAIEQELQHFVHGDAEQAKAPDKSVGQGKEDEPQHIAQEQVDTDAPDHQECPSSCPSGSSAGCFDHQQFKDSCVIL